MRNPFPGMNPYLEQPEFWHQIHNQLIVAIAAYAVGANQGYIYIRAEDPIAINRLQIAIRQAQRLGLLGSNIFDSPFDFKIDIRIGAGAYVCGEETALMASIEGKRHPV